MGPCRAPVGGEDFKEMRTFEVSCELDAQTEPLATRRLNVARPRQAGIVAQERAKQNNSLPVLERWPIVAMRPRRLPQLLLLLAVASVTCGCMDEECEAEYVPRNSQDPQVRRAVPVPLLGASCLAGSRTHPCVVT
jgi:hypothetical protein